MAKPEHILVIRFSAMGDVAMTVPVVHSLATQYPDVKITVLSRPFARAFYQDLAPNIHFVEADLKGRHRGVKGLNALYRMLNEMEITAVADLHHVLRSDYLRMRFKLSNRRTAHVNKHRDKRKQLVAEKNKKLEPLPTAFHNYSEVFARLGYPVNINFTSIFPTGKGNIRTLSAAIGEKKHFQEWIGIAPFAAHQGKIYPIEKIAEVAEKLLQRHPNCRLFFFGKGEKEEQLIRNITQNRPRCTFVAEVLGTLNDELILMSHLNVMLSMDSANMHLASLVNTPVVSVWGATHPCAGFLGWNQRQENIVQHDLDCRPCSIFGDKECKRNDWACIRAIDADEVIAKIERLL